MNISHTPTCSVQSLCETIRKYSIIEQLRYHCSLTFQFSLSVLLLFLPNLNIIALSNRSPIKNMRKQHTVYQVQWASMCGTGGSGKAPGCPYQPLRPSHHSRETVREGARSPFVVFSDLRPAFMACSRSLSLWERQKEGLGSVCVCVYVCDQLNNLCLWLSDSNRRACCRWYCS